MLDPPQGADTCGWAETGSFEPTDGTRVELLVSGSTSPAKIDKGPGTLRLRYTSWDVQALKGRKAKMDPAEYDGALEKLVTDLALKMRAIQELEGKKP